MPSLVSEFNPRLYEETEASILARILDPFAQNPDPSQHFNVGAGSFLYDLMGYAALEFLRHYERLNQLFGVSLIAGGFGDYLDQKGIELGIPRKTAQSASVVLTLTAAVGTVIANGARFSTTTADVDETPVEFIVGTGATVGVSGTVLLTAAAAIAGADANVPAHSITVPVVSIPGLIFVTNDVAATGGLDDETDDIYRPRLISAVRNASGPGTKGDYLVWATEIPGIDDALIYPLWAGPGTVKVVAVGPTHSIPTTATLIAAQQFLDPSVMILAMMEADEPWLGANLVATSKSEGGTSLELATPSLSTTVSATLTKTMSINFITASDTFTMWIDGAVAPTRVANVKVVFVDAAALEASRTITGIVAGPQTVTWAMSSMTVAPGFTWGSITAVRIEMTTTAVAGGATVRVDALRVYDASGGVGQGRAPIGAQVTVTSLRALPINISATITPSPGYTVAGIRPQIVAALEDFFATYNESTAYLYRADIASVIQNVDGVENHTNLTLNGTGLDVPLSAEDVPLLGTTSFT